ncbi:hypothetical protein CCACVL1_17336 [Corchorus capsularis]|uniref:Uncharacterized protein n=1 Tax=Corchorus capsularis TaxID=210143 RepID=A0A1R3HSF6_COCAP|nr:hypothetical protein CCACVL1_17336 [Corchorus capsularis]
MEYSNSKFKKLAYVLAIVLAMLIASSSANNGKDKEVGIFGGIFDNMWPEKNQTCLASGHFCLFRPMDCCGDCICFYGLCGAGAC